MVHNNTYAFTNSALTESTGLHFNTVGTLQKDLKTSRTQVAMELAYQQSPFSDTLMEGRQRPNNSNKMEMMA